MPDHIERRSNKLAALIQGDPERPFGNVERLAVLLGTTAAYASRLGDELDLGRSLSATDREEFVRLTQLLLAASDRFAFGSETREADADPYGWVVTQFPHW